MEDTATGLDWSRAEAVAERHRHQRLHPPARYARLDTWLRPVVVVVWAATTAATVAAHLVGHDLRDLLTAASTVGVLVTLVLGCWWLFGTDRSQLTGSERSIRSALPVGMWRSVRRQLAGRFPIDPDRTEVVVEAAHQQRRLLGGQIAFIAWYVPLYLSIAAESRSWWTDPLLAFGTAALAVGLVLAIVTGRRLARVIRQHPDAAE